jgi:hypothetical protein
MEQTRDYTKLSYVGINKSPSASITNPGDLVLQFVEVGPEGPKLKGLMYDSDFVNISLSEFRRQFRELGEKVLQTKDSWKYNIINFDKTELSEAEIQFTAMKTIDEQIRKSFKPLDLE